MRIDCPRQSVGDDGRGRRIPRGGDRGVKMVVGMVGLSGRRLRC